MIACVIAYLAGSHEVKDFREESVGKDGKATERTCRFGKFVGTDGKERVGIERVEYVTALGGKR